MEALAPIILCLAFMLDYWLGDPRWLPHLIVGYGQLISLGEKALNRGKARLLKGGLLAITLIAFSFWFPYWALAKIHTYNATLYFALATILLFYCLANRTLIQEGKAVIDTLLNDGIEAGRKRLSWIVGRETQHLNEQQVKKAVMETMAENLSDGVVAPLFYFAILGVPGAMAYKMVNTLDSMVGYKSDRYFYFGKIAAKIDDIANYLPARITAILMLAVTNNIKGIRFVWQHGHRHSSPNAGYPEAALAYIMQCQFGGPNQYHGKLLDKPYIGDNNRLIGDKEPYKVGKINSAVAIATTITIIAIQYLVLYTVTR